MAPYILKRIYQLIPLFFGITVISFWVIHMAPGRPTDALDELNPKVSLEVRERMTKLYGLDKPLIVQYGHWLRKLLVFDFGESFADGRPVVEKFWETIPVTFTINILSMALILGLGIPLGVATAVKKGALFDKAMTTSLFLAYAAPTFWIALLAMDLFGVKLGWLPVSGLKSLDFDHLSRFQKICDMARHLTLPILISSLSGLAGITRYIDQNLTDVLAKKYILAARSRALSERVILFKHGLRNALLPVITMIGLSVPGLVGGSVIFESIFAIPGTGRLFFNAVMARDYPVIMALLVISAILTLLGNLLADIGYALADPRIKYATHD
jgi:peptide/nickel transport system permease protein